ncbi:MAG: hypothetical protein ACRDSL_09430 [Pseudonocardiaceae bacterium]
MLSVRPIPNSDRVRVATVRIGDDEPVEIVFSGKDVVQEGSLVPVAPPGTWVKRRLGRDGPIKIRRRRYRGQVSNGMLCSLDELGWIKRGPDQVALLQGVEAGERLDGGLDWTKVVSPARAECAETTGELFLPELQALLNDRSPCEPTTEALGTSRACSGPPPEVDLSNACSAGPVV